MRFALFGDIHANLEGLQAVLKDSKEQGCTHYICLGDLVGYNANPSECLEIVREMKCPVIKGNHDEEAAINSDIEGLNPLAEAALRWTRDQLSDEQKSWLNSLEYVRRIADFTVVHSTLDSPEGWAYVLNKFDAMASFSYQLTSVCFHGHTHVPRIFVKDSSVWTLDATEAKLAQGSKYFINVGSVGQPRDGDWRAAYAIYEPRSRKVSIRRVEYDIKTAQSKILDAGLPELLASRLALGK
jgi:predicted phosphodiesterase